MSKESINDFPHPTIPKHTGMPTYETIQSVHRKLKANAASIQSELGGGAHRLLGLTLSNQAYSTITGSNFTRPANPGTLPIITAGLTQPKINAPH